MKLATQSIRIAIHYSCSNQAVENTIRSLHETISVDFEIVILADPVVPYADDFFNRLEHLKGIEIKNTPEPGGGAASYNQMISDARDIYVMIEAGAIANKGWFEQMSTALYAGSDYALAGPATNHCWNYQGISSDCTDDPFDIAQYQNGLNKQCKDQYLSSGPMHDLADFCIMVRGDTIPIIGAADIEYGRGPCWEIDYCTRAAKAGFKSIWVQSAFIIRDLSPVSKVHNNEQFMLKNKQLYQSKFCGAHYSKYNINVSYCNHCLGDACPDFTHIPPIINVKQKCKTIKDNCFSSPMISCVMPTRNRPNFVEQSIRYFKRQTYQNCELIIVYEDDTDLPDGIESDDVKLIKTSAESIGAKRELGTKAAIGEIIAHWDDDDWYSDHRLTRQILPILQGVADITGLSDIIFMMLKEQKFWSVTSDLFQQLFLENITGGSLMFRKTVWEQNGPYPNISLREDIAILIKGLKNGAKLCRLPGRDLSIYVRHNNNSWGFKEGSHIQPSGWQHIPMPDFLSKDASFYFKADRNCPSNIKEELHIKLETSVQEKQISIHQDRRDEPMVTCIMPTYNRRTFIKSAISHFLKQDYKNRELIIIDDGIDPIFDLIPSTPLISYWRLNTKKSLGEKRNIACEMARGEIIAHWDDDDWMAPNWLSSQVSCLIENDADLCGLNQMFFYTPHLREAWEYIYDGVRPWVGGGTLCYKKSFWNKNKFPDINVGEDNLFIWSNAQKKIIINPRYDLYIATIHAGNTSPKATDGSRWYKHSAKHIEAIMGSEIRPNSVDQ